jgi:hypothetical protein
VHSLQDRDCPPLSWYVNGQCYILTREPDTWDGSQRRCKEFGDDFSLANFPSQESYWWVITMIRAQRDLPIVWFGLNDIEEEGVFTWSDGTKLTYTNWNADPTEPNGGVVENCVTAIWGHDTARWVDVPCGHPREFYGLCGTSYPTNSTAIVQTTSEVRSAPLTVKLELTLPNEDFLSTTLIVVAAATCAAAMGLLHALFLSCSQKPGILC